MIKSADAAETPIMYVCACCPPPLVIAKIIPNHRFGSLQEVLDHLQQFLKTEIVEFQVRREFILSDLLNETKKAKFHPMKRVQVGEMLNRSTGVFFGVLHADMVHW